MVVCKYVSTDMCAYKTDRAGALSQGLKSDEYVIALHMIDFSVEQRFNVVYIGCLMKYTCRCYCCLSHTLVVWLPRYTCHVQSQHIYTHTHTHTQMNQHNSATYACCMCVYGKHFFSLLECMA